MKVAFLDIDGVMNSSRFFFGPSAEKRREDDTKIWVAIHSMDPVAVVHLNAIIAASGAKIVISSSWRLAWPLGILSRALQYHGCIGEVIGKTGYRSDGDSTNRRGLEIGDWLAAPPERVEGFVILDDSDDMGHLRPWLVRTTWEHGLLEEHVKPALERLEKPWLQ